MALLGSPGLLVLDEPTVGLDPLLRRDLWQTFHRLVEDGTTLLVSSHVMDEAAECDLLILMREGGLVAVESPDALRARTSGTLERLMSMPVAKLDLLAGYGVAFGLVALVQTALVAVLTLGPLGLDTERSPVLLVALALLNALLGVALGLFVSAFATSEFQAVQFMPAIVLPQLLLCGLFVARDEMAGWLEAISNVLPLTYAYDALARATAPGDLGPRFTVDVIVVVAVTLAALALGAATLRRRTP